MLASVSLTDQPMIRRDNHFRNLFKAIVNTGMRAVFCLGGTAIANRIAGKFPLMSATLCERREGTL